MAWTKNKIMEKKNHDTNRVFFHGALRAFDENENTAEFIISDESQDRHGTIIPLENWDLDNYRKNPVVMYQHAGHWSDDPDQIIGKGEVYREGNQLIGRVTFEDGQYNEKAEKVAYKVKFGSLNATSVGFTPVERGEWRTVKNESGEEKDVYFYGQVDLLEWSIVNIPSNPAATAKMLADFAPVLPEKTPVDQKSENHGDLKKCAPEMRENITEKESGFLSIREKDLNLRIRQYK